MTEIPLIQTPNQELSIELDEQDCTIQLRQLGDYFYLTLYVDSTLVIQNAICMPNVAILQSQSSVFRGNFMLNDITSDFAHQGQPTYEELGTRFMLYYLTADEVAQYVTH